MTHLDKLKLRAREGRAEERKKKKMTQFAQFTEPEPGDRFIPKDNIGHVVVIKPHEHKTGVITENSPNGTDAVASDVLDLDAPDGQAVYNDALLFGGPFVDALKPYLGQLVVVKIDQRKSKSGRMYCVPITANDADRKRAEEAFAKGDPFAPEINTVSSETTAKAPF